MRAPIAPLSVAADPWITRPGPAPAGSASLARVRALRIALATALAVVLALAAAPLAAATENPSGQPPFGAEPLAELSEVEPGSGPPPGFQLDAAEVLAI